MTPDMILHYAPDNASLCVRLALEELGRPYQTRLVDRARRAQRDPEYLQLNPNGLIPTLETPDGPMYETAAILLWLADANPCTAFPASDHPGRAAALTRLFWLSNTLHPGLRMLFYPDQYAPGSEACLRDVTRTRLCEFISQMASDTGHLATDKPSIIACYLAPLLRWCALYGEDTAWFELSRWPELQTFARAFETRPAAVRSAMAEGLGPTPFSAPVHPNPPEGSPT